MFENYVGISHHLKIEVLKESETHCTDRLRIKGFAVNEKKYK